jgi:MoxR-like ATPase
MKPVWKGLRMSEDEAHWREVQDRVGALKQEIAEVIVGQHRIVEEMLVALLCGGHCLIVGVPGLAKTLLVSTLGRILGLRFRRIQFTPDLMPSDIVGTEILQEGTDGRKRQFEFVPGPVFANLILADEINRTPPKTQAALLEAMQEKQVTAGGESRPLELPFVVFATQNPIEHEGTYPLPEAQLDRFFFSLRIEYPTLEEERRIVELTTRRERPTARTVLDGPGLQRLQDAVYEVPVPDHVLDAILRLVHATRPTGEAAEDYVRNYVAWGAGPRASQTLTQASRALALLRGRSAASLEEVRDLALPVLRHRVIPNYNATGEGVEVEAIVAYLVEHALQAP